MGAKIENRPAFEGAHFDKQGFCLTHPRCQLCCPIKRDGKLMYEELHRHCPSCISEKNKLKRSTSLGGGKVREGKLHGTPGRSSLKKQGSSHSRGSTTQQPLRRQYDTPFDEKGRCHYHRTVQLAAKKLGGGWKVLHNMCPKCMEEKTGDGDDRSVRSSSSKKSTGSRGVEDAKGQFDCNGCCVLHTHVQIAKKKMLGGWKVVRKCPACSGEDVGLDDDKLSVCSKGSRKSTRSAGSRSVRSSRSTSGKPGQAATSSRYGTLPFDGDGYCCKHPSVILAQKKMMGGWKILHNVCPECTKDQGGSKKAPRRKSSSGRQTDAMSDASSFKSGSVGSGSSKKKRIRVRNLKTEDEDGKPGKYSGDVNDEYRPHGQGTMKYEDGTIYEGVWNEGSQVHGKMRRSKKEA